MSGADVNAQFPRIIIKNTKFTISISISTYVIMHVYIYFYYLIWVGVSRLSKSFPVFPPFFGMQNNLRPVDGLHQIYPALVIHPLALYLSLLFTYVIFTNF